MCYIYILQTNGAAIGNGHFKKDTESSNRSKESFETIPILVACLTCLGFYTLMLLGFLNSLLFKPKVATEKNREVSN